MSAGTAWDIEIADLGAAAALPPVALVATSEGRGSWRDRMWSVIPALDLAVMFTIATAMAAPGAMPVALAATSLVVLLARGAYESSLRTTVLDALPDRLVAAAAGAAVAAAVHIYIEGRQVPPLGMLIALMAAGAAGLLLVRCATVLAFRAAGSSARPTAIVIGEGRVADDVARHLSDDRACGLRPVALHGLADLPAAVRRHCAQHLVIAFSEQRDEQLAAVAREGERLGLRVWVVPRLFDLVNHRGSYSAVGGLPVIGLRAIRRDDWRFVVKHAIDRLAAVLLLLATAPVLVLCALAVRLDSPGPALFRQRRVGCDGRVFQILKFRSMCPGAPTSAAGLRLLAQTAPGGVEGTDRRTLVGAFLRRTSLDELPQLFNVLRGEMSLVGPRPERPEFVEAFRPLARYDERHRVRSGITGWAQVHGLRGKTSITDRVAYDNHYIEHFSLWLDVKTLILTVLAVFRSAE